MKPIIKNIIGILLLCIIIPAMMFFSLISPYETWDETVIDYDALDALRFLWMFSSIFNAPFILIFRKSSRALTVIFALLTLFSIAQTVHFFII